MTLTDEMMASLARRRTSRHELSRALWRMTPAGREAAMWRGELSSAQLCEWASRRPWEVPLINGEFAFVAIHTPEVAEAKR